MYTYVRKNNILIECCAQIICTQNSNANINQSLNIVYMCVLKDGS